MDAILLAAFKILGVSTGTFPVVISIVIMAIAGYMYLKNSRISEFTSISEAQTKNIMSMMEQIEKLSDQLRIANDELIRIRKSNVEMSARIAELESLLKAKTHD